MLRVPLQHLACSPVRLILLVVLHLFIYKLRNQNRRQQQGQQQGTTASSAPQVNNRHNGDNYKSKGRNGQLAMDAQG